MNNKNLEHYGLNDLRIIYKKSTDKFIKPLEYFSKAVALKKQKMLKPDAEEDEIDEENDEYEEVPESQELEEPKVVEENLMDLDFAVNVS